MRTGKPAVLQTFDYRGHHQYFLTFCTCGRQRLLVSREAVDLVLLQIRRAATASGFAVLAYCAMPDHLHLLVEGVAEDSHATEFIKRAKQYSGFHFQRTFGMRLWQRYGFERALRAEDETIAVARYIVENPVRAGLVQAVTDYPYVGSDRWSLGEILEAVQMTPAWRKRSA